ncbi:hypothetical protein GCM10009677_27870 [Sphaerisporangium rubeum]|uniref:DUF4352 domain-containing protein n=1 Tax=Sphaerisporangium rubeum TaxID=321317 RepID=A0A7X0M6C0_9ACTN|nr:hypothetical protein [Sphaerisporangium rubeum]MBB6471696.1 hypothetical protein [Sphaerisporangium rubeum]
MGWLTALRAVTGLALVAAAVAMQPLRLAPERLNEPITASGGMHDELSMPRFSARLERVEFARTVRVNKRYGGEDAPTGQIFLIAKVGATAPKHPVQLHARLFTADGRRFDPTERVSDTAAMNTKWVQPGWWRSGLYFFEVPPDAVAGAKVVVSEEISPLFGDQFLSEAAFDTGLDGAAAKQAVGAAKDVYEVSG